MVRSVETVVNLLQSALDLKVNVTSAEVLRLNCMYKYIYDINSYYSVSATWPNHIFDVDEGNVNLRSGNVDRAIECYTEALDLRDREQEGVLLVMRGTALLQRAYASRLRYRDIVAIATEIVPTIEGMVLVLDSFRVMHPTAR